MKQVNNQVIGLIILGFCTSFISVSIGIGGGLILVSLLISVFNFEFRKASAASLAAIIPISFTGAVIHFLLLDKITHPEYFYFFIPPCVIGAVVGRKMMQKKNNKILKLIFSIFLILISFKMLHIADVFNYLYKSDTVLKLLNFDFFIFPMGLFLGITAASLGIGCGLLIVPFFMFAGGLEIKEAITLSLTTMFFLTSSATLMNNKLKTFSELNIKPLFLSALTGSITGAFVSGFLPAFIIRKIFGIFMLIMGLYYIYKELLFKKRHSEV